MSTIGETFRRGSSLTRKEGVQPVSITWSSATKSYRLPPPAWDQLGSLGDAIHARRSHRRYRGSMTQEQLALLLAASYGHTAHRRAVPSAGGLYPFDVYVLVNQVEGLPPGIYLYQPAEHVLDLRAPGSWGGVLAEAALGQKMCAEASAVLSLVAIFSRSTPRYGERAYRYVYLDAGHVVQNTYLAAAALGLGCCGIAAFYDEETNQVFGVNGQEAAVTYMATMGPVR